MKLTKFAGNPILSPTETNDWESLVTSNPGVTYDNGVFYMLYRAAGNDEKHVIRLGLATSRDGYHFERVSDKPAFGPSLDGPDASLFWMWIILRRSTTDMDIRRATGS